MNVSIVLALINLLYISSFPFSQGDNAHVLAAVGSYNITLSEFENRYENYLFNSGVKDNLVTREAILNNMINEILLFNYDSNDAILKDPKYQKELNWTKNQVALAYLKDQEIYASISVSEEEIREAFVRVNEKIAARHLYAESEEEANNLYELLKIGVDFDFLAKQVFTDSTLRNNGGYLGYFTWGDMDPSFEDAAFSLKVGEVSQPVKTEHGYSIIKLEDRISHPLLTEYEFLKKKSHLERVLKIRKKKPSEREYLKKVFDFEKVSFNQDALENILSELTGSVLVAESNNRDKSYSKCVEYEGKIYSQNEIVNRIDNIPLYNKEKIVSLETLQSVITGLLLQEKLLKIAHDKGYDSNPLVLDTFDKMSNNLFLKFKRKEIGDNSDVPDSSTLQYYSDNIQSFSSERELNLQEIILDDKHLADSLLNEIKSGTDFGDIAQKNSLRRWTAEKNGEMGFSPVSKFGMLKDTLWNSSVGEIIGPINIQDYCGIFKVLGKSDSKPFEFEKVKSEVIGAYKRVHNKELVKKYLEKLHSKISIKINKQLLGSINIAG